MKKKFTFMISCLLLISSFVSAQQRGPRQDRAPEQKAAQMVQQLHKELDLTDKQQNELKTLFTEIWTKRNKNFEKNRGDRKAMSEAIQKEQTEIDKKLQKILTAEQYKKYQENKKKRQESQKKRSDNFRPR